MTIETLLSVMLIGLISGNVIASTGVGIDIAGNNLNSIKNSLIFSLIIFGVTLLSGVVIYVTNLIFESYNLQGMMIIVSLMVVAIFTQIAEFILEKIFPVVFTKLNGFVVTIIPSVLIILLSIMASGVGFGLFLLDIIFVCLGITAVLAVISGIRNHKLTYSSFEVFKGNLMTLVLLFVMALIWTAV